MPIGTFMTTQTVSIAATSSTTLTHALSTTPHLVWATLRSNVGNQSSSSVPYIALAANSASLTVWNRGQIAATWTVAAAFFHSTIQ